jgi:hypothetical protein
MFRKEWLRVISVIILFTMMTSQLLLAGTATAITIFGADCPQGSKLAKPYTNIFINDDTGDVTHVETVGCDGVRKTGIPTTGIIHSYQAYNSYLNSDNVPSASLASGGGLYVTLATAAKVEVRDATNGNLIASLPASGSEQTSYTVSSSTMSAYNGKLIVVDVIRTSDTTYRGTKTIVFNP